MDVSPSRLQQLVTFVLVHLLCGHMTRGVVESNTSTCTCQRACLGDLSPGTTVGPPVYYHDSSQGGCVQLKQGCSLSSDDCAYNSVTDCESACGSSIGRCASTQNGCCPDGSARSKDGHCEGDTSAAESPGGSISMRWDLIATGMILMVLLVAVVSISGLLAYVYRQKHKQKQRSRYIHEVLQMYDGSSDSLSDSSVEDNPESNNLFDRL